jgi:hypothetical protein
VFGDSEGDVTKKAATSPSTSRPVRQSKPSRLQIVLAVLLLLLSMVAVYFTSQGAGDLYVALAGGRDVLTGHLNQPDDWAFTNKGRIWFHQNWGADVLIFLSYKLFGLIGLLGLKAVLIALFAFFNLMVLRTRAVPSVISLVVVSFLLISIQYPSELRANLFTLVFVPLVLWQIHLSKETPWLSWVAAATIVVWSNMHGGFAFGVMMISVWAVFVFVVPAIVDRTLPARNSWNYPCAAVMSVILSAILTPFGVANIMEPLKMAMSREWRITAEWQSIAPSQAFWQSKILFLMVSVIIVLMVVGKASEARGSSRIASMRTSASYAGHEADWFEYGLAVVACIMAFKSIRFVSLALIVMAPIMAKHAAIGLRGAAGRAATYLLMLGVCGLSGTTIAEEYRTYFEDHGMPGVKTVFDKMHFVFAGGPPYKLAEFINENGIAGNMFADWTWEGFIQWHCKDIKLFIGGRAQQAYDIETYDRYVELMTANTRLEDFPEGRDVHLIAIPRKNDLYGVFVLKLRKGKWVKVFDDGTYVLFMDATWAPYEGILKRLFG